MSYAKYGIDVHEKTVTNQLAHQGCATLLTGNVFAFTSYLTRLIFGPLRKLKVQGSFEFLGIGVLCNSVSQVIEFLLWEVKIS